MHGAIMHGADWSSVYRASAEGQLRVDVALAVRAERPETGMHSRQRHPGRWAWASMTAKLKRQGRPSGDAEQRSIRVPKGLWSTLEDICEGKNSLRDPLIDGKMTPSSLINVAVRAWLVDNGHDRKCYLSKTDEAA